MRPPALAFRSLFSDRLGRSGPRRLLGVSLAALGLGALSLGACGQVVGAGDDDDTTIDSGTTKPGRDAGRDSGPGKVDGSTPRADAGSDAGNDFVDPECPTKPPPTEQFDCDPLAQTGCQEGESCAPFVDYPNDPCEAETYGAFCIPAGTKTQGESCEDQTACAAGYICLITGAGTTCGRACDLNASGSCPDGLVCVSTDVSGIGACY